jgi:hypothetical protein
LYSKESQKEPPSVFTLSVTVGSPALAAAVAGRFTEPLRDAWLRLAVGAALTFDCDGGLEARVDRGTLVFD